MSAEQSYGHEKTVFRDPMPLSALGGTGIAGALHRDANGQKKRYAPDEDDFLRAAYFGYEGVDGLVSSSDPPASPPESQATQKPVVFFKRQPW